MTENAELLAEFKAKFTNTRNWATAEVDATRDFAELRAFELKHTL